MSVRVSTPGGGTLLYNALIRQSITLVQRLIRPKFRPLNLGPLPADTVNRCLNLTLPDGDVCFTIPAQKHAYRRHPDDYMTCVPFLSETILGPSHVGQAPDHEGEGFEMIKELPHESLIVLMAVNVRPTNRGIYIVRSVYPIDRNKLERRIRLKFVVPVKV